MKQLKKFLLISSISFFLVLFFGFLRNYNSPDKIEKRCTFKFQKDLKKADGKPDREWNLNMDIADENYLNCMRIP